MNELKRRDEIERRERPRQPRQTVNVRMVGGPANGKTTEADASADHVLWDITPVAPMNVYIELEASRIMPRLETVFYRRKDFAYRLISGKTRYWRIMVHEPDMTELIKDIDDLVCKAFDTFFGPSIEER